MKPEDGSTRGINRHRYSLEEADKALEQPVVEALLRLCKFRNTHPAFNGQARPCSTLSHKACISHACCAAPLQHPACLQWPGTPVSMAVIQSMCMSWMLRFCMSITARPPCL